MRLLLGIPTAGSPVQPFLEALARLQLPAAVGHVERSIWSGNFVAAQREMLMREAVEQRYDLLAMIDDDIVPPPDALDRLAAVLAEDSQTALAAGLYYSRDGMRPMVVDAWDSADTTSAAIPAYRDGAAVAVDGVGFGCSLVRVSAIAALTRPYARAHVYVDPLSRRVTQCDEDYLFCERLRRTGHRVVLHAGVRCGHYDRETKQIYPREWDDDAVTDRRRMIVEDAAGARLVPFDDSMGRAAERHERIEVEYLFSERMPRPAAR